jgi:hypothetical protein
LDDLTPFQQVTAMMANEAALFDIRPTIKWTTWNRDGNLGQRSYAGENPPNGALLSYYLKAKTAGDVSIEIADAGGKVIRRLPRLPNAAGVQRVVWDLREESAAPAGEGRGGRGGAAGTGVLPGTYQVTLVAGGQRFTKPVEVRNDPRIEMTPAQVADQYAAAKAMEATQARVTRVISGVDDLLRQLTTTQTTLRAAPAVPNGAAALTEIGMAMRDLRQFRDSVLARPIAGLGYRQYPRLREEVQQVSGSIARPQWPVTAGEKLRSSELVSETGDAEGRLDALVRERIGKINELLKGSQHIITPTPGRIIP